MKTGDVLQNILLISSAVTLAGVLFGILYWVVSKKLKEELFKVFITKQHCADTHKVTDVMMK